MVTPQTPDDFDRGRTPCLLMVWLIAARTLFAEVREVYSCLPEPSSPRLRQEGRQKGQPAKNVCLGVHRPTVSVADRNRLCADRLTVPATSSLPFCHRSRGHVSPPHCPSAQRGIYKYAASPISPHLRLRRSRRIGLFADLGGRVVGCFATVLRLGGRGFLGCRTRTFFFFELNCFNSHL